MMSIGDETLEYLRMQLGPQSGIIYTVFPNDPAELPHDFDTYREAKEYGDEEYGPGNYQIQSPI